MFMKTMVFTNMSSVLDSVFIHESCLINNIDTNDEQTHKLINEISGSVYFVHKYGTSYRWDISLEWYVMYFQMAYFQIKYGIPKCRPMMGCMDETNTLEYTEIFEHCLYWPNINLMLESGLKRDRF